MLNVWTREWCWDTVLDALVKLRKTTVSCTMSVCPHESTRLNWTNFYEILYYSIVTVQTENKGDLQPVYRVRIGPGNVVGIATAYGLDGPGIESRWDEIFRTSPDRP